MDWKPRLAYLPGSVDQELPVRNECLLTENRILRQQITGRVRLSDDERKRWPSVAQSWGRKRWRKSRRSSPLTPSSDGAGVSGGMARFVGTRPWRYNAR